MQRRHFLLSAVAAPLCLAPGRTAFAASPLLQPVADGLDHPWGLAFLPDGTALVTERVGRLRRVGMAGGPLADEITGLPDIEANGQGGLLGVAIDPEFAGNRLVYLAFTEPRDGGNSTSTFRARLSEDHKTLSDGRIIFRQNRTFGGGHHFGSRLVFDRTGHLFITTGDRGELRDDVQNPASHIGKVLRVTRDGAPAPGNPQLAGWAGEVWSLGHRNIQGAALHPLTSELWTAEHGARGGDEINIPRSGRNYGWPIISFGREYSGGAIGEGSAREGMEQPIYYWDPSIAPSGMAFCTGEKYPAWRGNLFVGALAGQAIARLELDGTRIVKEERLFEGRARFRDIVQGPDGYLYVLTDEAEPEGAVWRIAPAA